FFSSRRRHTSFSRDWSSDVCSSDLGARRPAARRCTAWLLRAGTVVPPQHGKCDHQAQTQCGNCKYKLSHPCVLTKKRPCANHTRSEERRVGKECRRRRVAERRKTRS